MDEHICSRCGICFASKYNLINHLKKKNICDPVLADMDVQSLLDPLCKPLLTVGYKCEYCDKYFKHSQGRSQHKKVCKLNPQCKVNASVIEHESLKERIDFLMNEVAQLKTQNQILSDKLHMLTCKRDEKFYQTIVEKYLGGTHKTLSCGVTDVTSDACHAEIKEWKCWKEAVGQLTCYNAVDPKDCLQLYLFGKYKQSCKDEVFKVTSTCKIEMFDFDEGNGVVYIRTYPDQVVVYEHRL